MNSLFETLVQFTSPNSLTYLNENQKQFTESEFNFSQNLLQKIQPGDIIITKTPSTVHNIVRKITSTEYDHVSVVLNKEQVIHIAPPKVRLIKSYIFLMEKYRPIVLRPNLNQEQTQKFLDGLMNQQFQNYDYNQSLKLLGLKFLDNFVLLDRLPQVQQQQPSVITKKRICSDLVFYCLAAVSEQFKVALQNQIYDLDFYKYGNFSPDDLILLFYKDQTGFFGKVQADRLDLNQVAYTKLNILPKKSTELKSQESIKQIKKKYANSNKNKENNDYHLFELFNLERIQNNSENDEYKNQNQSQQLHKQVDSNNMQNHQQQENQFKEQLQKFKNEAQIILDNYQIDGQNFFVKTKSLVDQFLILANYNRFFTFPFINRLVQYQVNKKQNRNLASQLLGYQGNNKASKLWFAVKIIYHMYQLKKILQSFEIFTKNKSRFLFHFGSLLLLIHQFSKPEQKKQFNIYRYFFAPKL